MGPHNDGVTPQAAAQQKRNEVTESSTDGGADCGDCERQTVTAKT